ncbi:MAG: AAA family ATPase [Candidatus Hodarchaeota archaeon]
MGSLKEFATRELSNIKTPEISPKRRISLEKYLLKHIQQFENIYQKENMRKISIKKVRITGFEEANFDQIDLAIGSEDGIFLIEGPNFSGKTTTLELILYSILGKQSSEEFSPYIISKINRTEITLQVNNETYRIHRDFYNKSHKVIFPSGSSPKNFEKGISKIFGFENFEIISKILWNVFYLSQEEQKIIFRRRYKEGGYNENKILSILFQNPFSDLYFLFQKILREQTENLRLKRSELKKKNYELESIIRKIKLHEREIEKISNDLVEIDIKLKSIRKEKSEILEMINEKQKKINGLEENIWLLRRELAEIKLKIEVFQATEISREIFSKISPESCPVCDRELTEKMRDRSHLDPPKCPLCNRDILKDLGSIIQKSIEGHMIFLEKTAEAKEISIEKLVIDCKRNKRENQALNSKVDELNKIEKDFINFLASLKVIKEVPSEENKDKEIYQNEIKSIESSIEELNTEVDKHNRRIGLYTDNLNLILELENSFTKQIQDEVAKKTNRNLEEIVGKLELEDMIILNQFEPYLGDLSIKDLLPGSFRHLLTISFLFAVHHCLKDYNGKILFPFLIDEPSRHLDSNSKASFFIFLDLISSELDHQIVIASPPDEGLKGVAKEIRTMERRIPRLDMFLNI